MEKTTYLVTGATGHLGYNLAELLIHKGENVITTYRSKKEILDDLDCESRYADIMDKTSLLEAFKGVNSVFAVGAAFKMWAKNPKKDIYDVNMQGTKNLFEAAEECGVKNIVYVSSIAALDFTKLPANPNNGYNRDRRNWYFNSKNDSDKLALELAKRHNIRTVLVLPSTMIGDRAHKLSYSNNLVKQILDGEMIAETNFMINWIDVKDVAQGAYSAMLNGKNGERYVLANEKDMSITDSVKLAAKLFPDLKLRTPPKVPKFVLYTIGGAMELFSKITGKEPLLQRHYVSMFYGLKQHFNISKSKTDLDFNPTEAPAALKEALEYIKEDWEFQY